MSDYIQWAEEEAQRRNIEVKKARSLNYDLGAGIKNIIYRTMPTYCSKEDVLEETAIPMPE